MIIPCSGFVIQRGVIEEPPCGPTASGQALYFNRRAASSGTRFRRRRGNTPTINFASTSRECNLPQPLLRTNQGKCVIVIIILLPGDAQCIVMRSLEHSYSICI